MDTKDNHIPAPAVLKDLNPEITAAIPCFNTERTIGDIVTKAKRFVDRVIVVNDGSADRTAAIAEAAGAVLVNHDKNRGYGAAIQSCIRSASASNAGIIITMDGDGQHDPGEIPALLGPLLDGTADMVIGSRFLSRKGQAIMPAYRKFGIKVITFLCNLGTGIKVTDSQSGFRAYRAGLFTNAALREKGMSNNLEIIELARHKKARIAEVPVTCSYASPHPSRGAFLQGLDTALAAVRIKLRYLLKSAI